MQSFIESKDHAASPFPQLGYVTIHQKMTKDGRPGEVGELIVPHPNGDGLISLAALDFVLYGGAKYNAEYEAGQFKRPVELHERIPLDAVPVRKGGRDIFTRPNLNTIEPTLYIKVLAHVEDAWADLVIPHKSTALTPGQKLLDHANDSVGEIDGCKVRCVTDLWRLATKLDSNSWGSWQKHSYTRIGPAPIEVSRRALELRAAFQESEKARFEALAKQDEDARAALAGSGERPRGVMMIESGRRAEGPSPFPKRPAPKSVDAPKGEDRPPSDDPIPFGN